MEDEFKWEEIGVGKSFGIISLGKVICGIIIVGVRGRVKDRF